jgi:hypothetical protein
MEWSLRWGKGDLKISETIGAIAGLAGIVADAAVKDTVLSRMRTSGSAL